MYGFLLRKRELRNLNLCGNELPWVSTGKHLGMRLENDGDIFQQDIREKRARYIRGNNQLMQEFAFADCPTKIFINNVYNSHHYGSVLWDLYSREAEMVYNTWSVSTRLMLRIDRKSHRYLIEPLSEIPHLRRSLLLGFNSFVQKLQNSRCAKCLWGNQGWLPEHHRIKYQKCHIRMSSQPSPTVLRHRHQEGSLLSISWQRCMDNFGTQGTYGGTRWEKRNRWLDKRRDQQRDWISVQSI